MEDNSPEGAEGQLVLLILILGFPCVIFRRTANIGNGQSVFNSLG